MKIFLHAGKTSHFFKKRADLLGLLTAQGHQVTLGGYEECSRECREFGVEFARIPMSRSGVNPLQDLRTLWCYYRVIRRGRFDLVHSYTAKPNIYGSLAAKLAGVKRIYPVVNGLGYAFSEEAGAGKWLRRVMTGLYRVGFSGAEKVIFQNPDDARELIRRKAVRREQCAVVAGSGVDLGAYPFTPELPRGRFLMATRLLRSKGVETYCEAARRVRKRFPQADFALAGAYDQIPDGIRPEQLRPYLEDGSVRYLGHVEDMAGAIGACSVFVLPSYYREGVPHAILEAMSMGRAIVTTDRPGCRETVDGTNGILVPARDPDALAKAMEWMLEHPEEAEAMGRESRRLAEERFDVEKVNRELCRIMGIFPEKG